MSQSPSIEPEEGDEEFGTLRRGSTHAIWTQRRQAKRRAQVRAGRRRADTATNKKGIHLRRNKRLSW